MYPVIHVPDDAAELTEVLGTKPKFWYTDASGMRTLYKEGRPGSGEHWAEKVCCEICRMLTIPHAEYELAQWRDRKGVVSPLFVRDESRLVLGNELLGKMIEDYPKAKRFEARQHTVRIVMAIMATPLIELPLGYEAPAEIRSAADMFVGYLMLDALVGNQDRHDENWGLILSPGLIVSLAPTFDHASSLGRNESDEERLRRLATRDQGSSIKSYAQRAMSAMYSTPASKRPLSTLAAFEEAAKISREAATYWVNGLRQTSMPDYESIVARVPPSEMSDPARQFALQMIQVNRERLVALDIMTL